MNNNEVIKKELIKLSEEIQQTIDTVTYHKEQLENFTSPQVLVSKFNLIGYVTADDVNKIVKELTLFTCKAFNLTNTIHNFHNGNIQHVCDLIALITLAEVELYKNQKELSILNKNAQNKINTLYDKLTETIKSEQNSKNKISVLIEFTHALSELKTANFQSLKQNVDSNSEQLENYCNKLNQITQKVNQMEDLYKIERKNDRTFFWDSTLYKILVGLTSVSALILSLM